MFGYKTTRTLIKELNIRIDVMMDIVYEIRNTQVSMMLDDNERLEKIEELKENHAKIRS